MAVWKDLGRIQQPPQSQEDFRDLGVAADLFLNLSSQASAGGSGVLFFAQLLADCCIEDSCSAVSGANMASLSRTEMVPRRRTVKVAILSRLVTTGQSLSRPGTRRVEQVRG